MTYLSLEQEMENGEWRAYEWRPGADHSWRLQHQQLLLQTSHSLDVMMHTSYLSRGPLLSPKKLKALLQNSKPSCPHSLKKAKMSARNPNS